MIRLSLGIIRWQKAHGFIRSRLSSIIIVTIYLLWKLSNNDNSYYHFLISVFSEEYNRRVSCRRGEAQPDSSLNWVYRIGGIPRLQGIISSSFIKLNPQYQNCIFYFSLLQGHLQVVQYLLGIGADPNSLNDTNRWLLFLICAYIYVYIHIYECKCIYSYTFMCVYISGSIKYVWCMYLYVCMYIHTFSRFNC